MYTTLYLTVDDGETSFEVPDDWLREHVAKTYEMDLESFLDEYTSEESDDILAAALLEGVFRASRAATA